MQPLTPSTTTDHNDAHHYLKASTLRILTLIKRSSDAAKSDNVQV